MCGEHYPVTLNLLGDGIAWELDRLPSSCSGLLVVAWPGQSRSRQWLSLQTNRTGGIQPKGECLLNSAAL